MRNKGLFGGAANIGLLSRKAAYFAAWKITKRSALRII
jgi:hypothetical protein